MSPSALRLHWAQTATQAGAPVPLFWGTARPVANATGEKGVAADTRGTVEGDKPPTTANHVARKRTSHNNGTHQLLFVILLAVVTAQEGGEGRQQRDTRHAEQPRAPRRHTHRLHIPASVC